MKATAALKAQLKLLTNHEQTKSVRDLLEEIERLREQIEVQDGKIQTLKRQAMEDALTGLMNRRAFEKELKGALSYFKRYGRSGAVLLIDVDAFKGINDSLGHLAGDELLKHLAKLLKTHVRETDVVARLGGDEFCIILREVETHEVRRKVSELISAVSITPCYYDGKEIHMSISVGACQFTQADNLDELLDKADKSMYAQKNGVSL